jgi:predicted dehydrogenase
VSALRVGVAGVGSLGQHHARVYAALPGVELAGVYDRDPSRAAEIAGRHDAPARGSFEELLATVDALSIAAPTVEHHALARRALLAGKDVLVEKPMTATLAEADDLIALAAAGGRVLQVGHIERFNPAADVLRAHVRRPRFIEVHRLSGFPARSLDVDVVLDVMIHDLDIVLALDGSEPVQVEAVGVPVLTPKVDIANARLRFGSGLIANLTASRVSAEKVRKFRVFAPRTYISVDFAAREAQVYRLRETEGGRPDISVERTAGPEEEPLQRQLAAFVAAVRERTPPLVSGVDGRRALALALAILERIAADSPQPES